MFSLFGAQKNCDGTGNSSSNNSNNLNLDSIDFSLNTLYETYLELCQIGCDNKITSIVLYSKPQGDVFIDVLLDGSYFLNRLKNDILTAYYTLPDGEDPNTWHFRRARIVSKPISNRELNMYLSSYKQRNKDKGIFLDLIKVN